MSEKKAVNTGVVEQLKRVKIYTDGACSGNPGKGGWAAILVFGNYEKEISGGVAETTNNRMEITAVIEGLRQLRFRCVVNVYSDSTYVINAFNQNWLRNWKKNGWLNSARVPVSNRDLWEELDELQARHVVIWNKVKAHADHEYNNRCDALARAAIPSD